MQPFLLHLNMQPRKVKCNNHGQDYAAFICQHLNKITKVGFNEAFPSDPNNIEEFQAWCDECEKVRVKADGWNDEGMELANIKLVCTQCYFEIKEINK
jgi:hypothetical protein